MDILISYPNHILFSLFLAFIFGVIVTFRPAFGFYAVCLFLPAYILRIYGTAIPTNVLELLIVMTVLGWLGYSLGHRKTLRNPQGEEIYLPDKRFLVGVCLIVAGAFISLAVSKNEFFLQGAGIFKGFIIEPIIFSIALYSASKQKLVTQERIIKTLVWSASIVAIVSLVGVVIPGLEFWTYDNRLRGFYLSPNYLAMYLAPLAPLFGYLIYKTKQKEKFIYIISGLTVLFVVFLTKSFGAWLGLSTAVVFAIFLLKSDFNKVVKFSMKRLVFGTTIAISIILGFVLRQEIADFLVNSERSSWASRIQIWNAALAILKDNPLLGIGLGTFQEYYLAYQKYFPPYLEWAVPQPHNLVLAFWLQTGIIGLIGFLWLITNFFKKIKIANLEAKLPSKLRSGDKYKTAAVIAAVIIVLVQGLIDTTIWKNDLAAMFFVLMVF